MEKIQIPSPPSNGKCLGCRTFFQENQTLPLECMTIQYKNFSIPLQQNKHKWNILKTIVSFLNTKGGTIYIGIEDSNCKVIGKQLTSKIRDQFKLYLLQLTERIVPEIDLNHKEELQVQYVPIVKNKTFTGKYITKIIVKQGDPCQTYCFSQKVVMASQTKRENQGQNLQIVYSFARHNMGGAREMKGMKLIEQAIKKAQNPPPKFNAFHQQCNPQPTELGLQTKKIGFKNFNNRQSRRKFQRIFKQNLQSLKANCQVAYDTQLKALIIQFKQLQQFKRINTFIETNLSSLNESYSEAKFVDCGDYLGIHFYQNTLVSKGKNDQQQLNGSSPKKQQQKINNSKPTNNKETKQKQQVFERLQKKQKFEKTQKLSNNIISQEKKQKKKEYRIKHDRDSLEEQETQSNDEIKSLTLTHINPHIKDKLVNYLNLSISKKIDVDLQLYENTIEVLFKDQHDLEKYCSICSQPNHLKALQNFGFNKEIRMGFNTGYLHILNFDKDRMGKLVEWLKFNMSSDLEEIQVIKKGNRHVIYCKMSDNSLACAWLDRLLISKPFKDYSIPGAHKGMVPKMKVFIHCQDFEKR